MLVKNLDNSIINLTDIRVIIGENQEEETIDIDFYAEMPISKDSLNNPQTGWMFDQEFRASLSVYVIEITDPKVYNVLKKLDKSETAQVLYEKRKNFVYDIVKPPRLTEKQILSLGKHKDQDGNMIYKVPFKIDRPRVRRKTEATGTLAYFLIPVLDSGDDSDESFVKTAFRKEIILNSKPSLAVKQFSTVDTSPDSSTSVVQGHYHTYYVDEDGNGYASSAFSEAGQYNPNAQHKHKIIDGKVQAARSVVTGKIHVHAIESLSVVEKENSGIVDTRNIEKTVVESKLSSTVAENIKIPTVQTNIGVVPKGIVAPSARRVEVSTAKANMSDSFSDLTLSKDENNNNNMVFALNFNNLVKQSSFLTTLPNNNSLKDLFISNSKILSLKVYRTRLDEEKGPGTSKEQSEKPFLVAESSDNNNRTLVAKKKYVDFENNDASKNSKDRRDTENKGQLVGSISELTINNTNMGIRQFACSDNAASRLTNGKFKYYVEAEITDPLPETLEKFAKEMTNNKTQLENYFASVGSKKANTSFNYDSLANRFKANFINVFYENNLNAPMLEAVQTYKKVLSYFQSTADLSVASLYAMVDPRTATLDTIQQIISLHQQLITRINKLLGREASGTSKKKVKDGAAGTYTGQNSDKRKIKVNKHFVNNLFTRDITQQKNIGYDFLGQKTTEEGGLKSVSVADMKSRFDKELRKVNIQPNQETLELSGKSYTINKVGELTPDRILIAGKKNAVTDPKDVMQNLNANLLITQVNQKQQTRKQLLKDKELQASKEVIKWANNTNITVISLQSEMLEQLEGADVVDLKTSLTGSGIDTKELQSQIKRRKQESTKPGILTKIYNSFFDTNLTNKNNRFVKKLEEKTSEELQELPYHTIALASEVSGSGPVEYPNSYQNYVNMYKVEIFDGYEESQNGDKSTLSPKYKELKDMNQVKGNTLARLVPYENVDIDIRQEKNLQLPVLDEHFILRED